MSDLTSRTEYLGEMTLDELGALAVAEAESSAIAYGAAITHGIRCGDALVEARKRVPQGKWGDWLDQYWPHSGTHAQQFIRLSLFWEELPVEAFEMYVDNDGNTRQPTLGRANLMIRALALPSIDEMLGRWNTTDDSLRPAVTELRKQGKSYREIVEETGVPKSTVAGWCNPQAAEKALRRNLARRKREAAERRALKEKNERQERERLARATGGELSNAYANIRKALSALDRASAPHEVIATLHRAETQVVDLMRKQ